MTMMMIGWMQHLYLYKNRGFNKKAGIRISILGQPAVDTGCIRNQFFSVVLESWL